LIGASLEIQRMVREVFGEPVPAMSHLAVLAGDVPATKAILEGGGVIGGCGTESVQRLPIGACEDAPD
jgi:hypothetical protein